MRRLVSLLVLIEFGGGGCGGQATTPKSSGGTSTGQNPPGSFSVPSVVERGLLSSPRIIASDGVTVFWIDANQNLWSDPVAGGSAKKIANAFWSAGLLYLNSNDVYFASETGISSVPKLGGTSSTLISVSGAIQAATVVDNIVYWTEIDADSTVVKSAPLVASGVATSLYMTQGIGVETAIAVSGASILVGPHPLESFIPDAGGVSLTVNGGCVGLLSGDGGIYCASPASISFVTLSGGSVATITPISTAVNQPQSMVLDEGSLYWVNPVSSGSVAVAPIMGGQTSTVAQDDTPLAVAVDTTAVYWSDKAGTLQRVLKQ